MNRTRNGGFTLVELIVTIAVGSIITLACTTVLLLCLRVYNQSTDTATRQNEIRVGLTVMENLLAEKEVTGVEGEPPATVLTTNGDTLLYYYKEEDSETGTIFTNANAPILDNVASCVFAFDPDNRLLTYTLQIGDETYASAVRCRVISVITEGNAISLLSAEPDESTLISSVLSDETLSYPIRAFLTTLTSQLGSKGRILTGEGEGDWYSRWYIGSYEDNPGWSEATPWCACYVSWALEECRGYLDGATPRFANVDSFCAEFVTTDNWKTESPAPGDLVFFDWIVDPAYNPQHVGVVLTVRDGWVYTVEGNSNGRVAVCKYALDDAHILGYGILNWT